ncbi:hypothetical protein [Rhodopseudomonas palustris]|uniref:hypothetical protein n=1 Tax=Rhodopseudomonas palustris TaxID=1076 RepID=UPI0021F3A7CA|nr:hypothetical protein [Rhodopseudomonas palustris]UYO53111.1 hypothetical protein KQX61_21320 [Rhodopseudomonas palustris]
MLVSVALFVLGTKLLFIRSFGSAVPYWDQWDAEADLLYKPYLNSDLSFSALFSSHNEHRILITRILALVLFELNGGWDPILQMVVNAVLHVGAIIVLLLILRRIVQPASLIYLILFSALLFALPIGWENLLGGFQSQFYFLVIFSFLALLSIAGSRGFSIGWWGGLLFSVAAFFSMASGALTGAAVIIVSSAQILTGRRKGGREYIAVGFLCLATIVMMLSIENRPYHEIYKAHSVSDFAGALVRCLSFPRLSPVLGIWVSMPAFIYLVVIMIARPLRRSSHWILLGIVVWLFAQEVSLAYGRAVLINSPRYLDLIILCLPVNFAILLLAQSWMTSGRARAFMVLATSIWLCVVIPALVWNAVTSSGPAVVSKGQQAQEQERSVLSYLQTRNLAVLQSKPGLAIPYPSPERLAALLSDQVIRMTLPDSLRPRNELDDQKRADRMLLKGKLHEYVDWLGKQALRSAHVLVGIAISLAFAVGMFGALQWHCTEQQKVDI